MTILLFIGVVVLAVVVVNLRDRVVRLEGTVLQGLPRHDDQAQPQGTGQPGAQGTGNDLVVYITDQLRRGVDIQEIRGILTAKGWQPADIAEAERATQVVEAARSTAQQASSSDVAERFVAWAREDWMLKLGAFLILIGFGWFTTYAFLQNWIGPLGRITLGILAGTAVIGLGTWRIRKYLHQGGVFLVLGSTIVLLTVYAGREFYGMFTPASALALMFLSTVFVAFASVKYNNRALAFASLVLAGIAPLLTNGPADYVGLFSYLLIVVLGTIWVVLLTGRRELTPAALMLVLLYSAPHFFSSLQYDQILLLFAYAFTGIFFLTNTIAIVKARGKDITADLLTAAGNGFFLLIWVMTNAPTEWKSLIISTWMIVFAAGAYMIFKASSRREPFYVYAAVCVAMLAAATSAQLSGATLTIAYTIESGAIALLSHLIMKDIRITERASLLLAGPMLLSFGSMISSAWDTGVLNKDFFVLLVLAVMLFGLGLFFLEERRVNRVDSASNLYATLLVSGSIYAYILLWLSLQAGLHNENLAVMSALVTYTIIGLICYFYGLSGGKRGLQLYGGLLVGFVVGRLLLVDVWRMELTGRIITFFLIGALLAGTAFIGKGSVHKKALSDEQNNNNEA